VFGAVVGPARQVSHFVPAVHGLAVLAAGLWAAAAGLAAATIEGRA